jgi:hypothetical protein
MQDIKKKQSEGAPTHKELKRTKQKRPLRASSSGIHGSPKESKRHLYRLNTPFVAVFLHDRKKKIVLHGHATP